MGDFERYVDPDVYVGADGLLHSVKKDSLAGRVEEFSNPCHDETGRFCQTPSGGGVGGKKKGAGWKKNPEGEGLRYYDGTHWTEHVQTKAGTAITTDKLPVVEGGTAKAAPSGGFVKPPPGTVKEEGGKVVPKKQGVISRLLEHHKAAEINKAIAVRAKKMLNILKDGLLLKIHLLIKF